MRVSFNLSFTDTKYLSFIATKYGRAAVNLNCLGTDTDLVGIGLLQSNGTVPGFPMRNSERSRSGHTFVKSFADITWMTYFELPAKFLSA